MPGKPEQPAIATLIQNRFDRMEVAGASATSERWCRL
jgi:hypothetical protein